MSAKVVSGNTGYGAGKTLPLTQTTDGRMRTETKIVELDSDVTLTGDVVLDTFGALNDAKVVNPDAASATLPALARGQLKQLVDILAKLSADPATETTLAGVLAKLSDDPASEATLAGVATDAKVDALIALVATEETLAGVATDAKVDALIALVGDGSDSAGDPTVIGLLKQIAENTTPAP